ncbi:carbohydrate kinase [Actinoplanes sp. SE50]|uniref:NAD(P)H-hydrate dehydratase n=1 Tax=unclassified Actinoplanes TaxID=2626549 RepID=UPI00023ED099|nr:MULTISPECIES: NAD(P)H-hydrate dehydratase [unclassified Actinoplanes]AEV84923.1 Hydroxyethylthiazole kinase [Actinoplanes sp. SE50/110]ATO83314.1 carbohydrate kinase [Actinoplanes sp. SE50]SLM00721.1 NAD(P)H-hydrate dehydratase [Actinoplanes sp. SE50/110]
MPSRPEIITPRLLRDWPLPDPQASASKQDRGTVLVVGGAKFTPGAVLLAGVAALRAGAGRLQLAVADEAAIPLSIAVPEAKVVGLPEQVDELAADADVILLGPGLDDIGETEALMRRVLGAAGKDTAVVLDAYALGALSREPDLLPQPAAVLTPNLTEAAHLLGREPGDDLVAASRELAQRYRAVVSLYGHIADPAGNVWREESGDAGLGTSGSGDVRAGIVAGLLGRGAEPAQAACWAAFAHAVSGQRLSPRHGRTGFLARELVDEVAITLATV